MSVDPDTFEDERRALLGAIGEARGEVFELARWMAAKPELALEEREASRRYRDWLSARGFAVETGSAGLETAFVASRPGAEERPALRIALLAEMDALPDLGHACGHNLSGPASLLAAHALGSVLPPERLDVRVIGCPAEEIGLGKRRLVEAGVFDGLDAALMAHAAGMRRAHRLFLGNRKLEVIYHGRSAHAAAYPERGINALDAVVQLFVALGALRQQLPFGVRLHGIITDGGRVPNVIPERSAARIWVRALDDVLLAETAERVIACARGAAEAVGARCELREEEGTSPPMLPNLALANLYREQLRRLGLEETGPGPEAAIGSSDITHVSRVVPTIHPNFPIGDGLELHTRAFAAAAASEAGLAGLQEAASALVLTVHALLVDPVVRRAVSDEFGLRRSAAREAQRSPDPDTSG